MVKSFQKCKKEGQKSRMFQEQNLVTALFLNRLLKLGLLRPKKRS